MSYQHLKTETLGNIEIVTISNPASLNALNKNFFIDLNNYVDQLQKNSSIKVLIITGEGKSFVAGADISEMKGMTNSEGLEFSKTGQSAFQRLENLEIPVIAAINGFALGGGFELALACDFRIASTKAKFSLPEVSLGLIPGYGGTQRLSRLSNLGNALFLQLTGEMIRADDALRMNIIQKISEPEELMDNAIELAKSIIAKSPNAVKTVKKLVRNGFQMNINEALKLEQTNFSEMFSIDGQEGMNAFLEKRKPDWNK